MISQDRVEIAVVGAGPAGGCAAGLLAQAGWAVALFERDTFPRDKVCGEFLSPESIDVLEQVGCLEKFLGCNPSVMHSARFATESTVGPTVALPEPARGLSRRRLDEMLFEHAETCGALCVEGADVRRIEPRVGEPARLRVRCTKTGGVKELRADVVVAAYGRRTRIDRQLDRPFFDRRSRWVAFKRHHRCTDGADVRDLKGCVELHAFDGGYCGVSFVEDDVVNVCAMFDRQLLRRPGVDGMEFWEFLRRGNSALARRLSQLRPVADRRTMAVAQIPLGPRQRRAEEGVFFIGDAAGMIAPLAGDGQAMALQSATDLAGLLNRRLPRRPHRQWNRLWRRRYGLRVGLGRWLQKAAVRPSVADPLVGLLGRFPPAAKALVSLTRA